MSKKFNAKSTADEVLSGVDIRGKRFLVTGASSGIGLETVRSLAAHGASVVATARDLEKAQAATASIRNAASREGGSVELIELDLASLQSIRACADRLLADGRRFDAVIANAGVMATPFGRTADGFETQFGTNYLGHFALVNQIEPLIADDGRLVVLSSQAHRVADVDLNDPNFEQQAYDPFIAYGRSKTAASLFAAEFDRRHRDRGIRAASVMPGNSLTDLPRHFSQEELQGLFETVGKARAVAGLAPAELKEIPQAAATSVWAAVVADKDEIGGHYLEDCAVAPINDTPNPFADGARSYALDADKAKRLWVKSEELIAAIPAYGRKAGAAEEPVHIHHRVMEVQGVDVFYREAGSSDAPTILLLHGFAASSYMFRDLMPKLAHKYHVIAPDLPGFGQTTVRPGVKFDYTFDNLTSVIDAFTVAKGVDRYAMYVFDFGAPVGWRLAVNNPQKVTAIVSQNGNAYEEGLSAGWADMRKAWAEPTAANRETLRRFNTLEMIKWQYTEGVNDTTLIAPEGYQLAYAAIERIGVEVQMDLLLDYGQNIKQYTQLHEYFRRYQPPTLAIWGQNDPFFTPAGAEAFKRDNPKAEVRFLDTGHLALETHGKEIAEEMLEFLDRSLEL